MSFLSLVRCLPQGLCCLAVLCLDTLLAANIQPACQSLSCLTVSDSNLQPRLAVLICCCAVLQNNVEVPQNIQSFITGATFSTLTNVNFDEARFVHMLQQATDFTNTLKSKLKAAGREGACSLYCSGGAWDDVKDRCTIPVDRDCRMAAVCANDAWHRVGRYAVIAS